MMSQADRSDHMFGVTQYRGDRMTVNAALDLRRNEADLQSLATDRQSYLDAAHERLQEASALSERHRKLRQEAEAVRKAAEDRLAKTRRLLADLDHEAASVRQAVDEQRYKTTRRVDAANGEWTASESVSGTRGETSGDPLERNSYGPTTEMADFHEAVD